MSIQCKHCDNLFVTKSKRDNHTIEEHISTVIIGETNVSRTSSGFPCPCCRKYLKNAKTFRAHLAKKQLPCLFVYDSAPQSDPRESLSLNVEPDALTNAATTAETTSSVNTSEESPLIESTASNVSTISTLLASSPTSSTLFSSILDELSFSPSPIEDRLLFNSIDVSAQFYKFQLDVQSRLREDAAFTIEEHMQHILALSSVLLLKPARTHEDLHRYIDLNTCEGLRRHILSKQQTAYQPFPASTRNRLEEIMGQMDLDGDQNNICTRLVASCRISAMIQDDGLNSTNRILLIVRNMVEKLPRHTVEDGPKETELITRTSVSDEEKQATTRPDASINIINGAVLSKRIGCGEVKAQYQALNHRLVGIDLMRITVLAKAASDKHKLKEIFAFTVVGKYATFYMFTRAQAYLYTMCEIAHIQLPLTLDHVPLFLSQLDKVVKIISCFQYTLNSGNHNYANDPSTLTDNMLHNVTDPKSSRKRKSITSHYNH
ncbi:hypothetical protein BCV72DRAFT_96253 [Rhizopus microsporus var. microsporus]|uniref:C2H2-type domain-containing protein n=1 Tax=Rhizopus microsporus var. microsporus TaxID=86635 RepID=A0A1X0QM52_RHIZD|nr:hypothetical protein BCV72DRAFT_96253 [Rhizopus microsporus var. microsporus]